MPRSRFPRVWVTEYISAHLARLLGHAGEGWFFVDCSDPEHPFNCPRPIDGGEWDGDVRTSYAGPFQTLASCQRHARRECYGSFKAVG